MNPYGFSFQDLTMDTLGAGASALITLTRTEDLDDLGVKRNTWWGYGLHIVFDNFRFPFTSVGFRYDLNHDTWTGPDNGNGFAAR
jgi:hypothetical protein